VQRAKNAVSDADRLFYYRRAVRLCSTEPGYHVEIGKLYINLGRIEDAKFEFKQAIDLDPSNQMARDQLSKLDSNNL
jgi:Flp pilus assembly protein TadD